MLHQLFALREEGIEAYYNARLARAATNLFLEEMDQGRLEYLRAIKEFGLRLYGRALSRTGKSYFLDKTPRYYLIIKELFEVFPEAHFLILFRHPMAVLASTFDYFVREHGKRLSDHRMDLLDAPTMLLEGVKALGSKAIVIHYERLVNSPEKVLSELCRLIGVGYDPSMVEYGSQRLPRWRLGDQKKVYAEGQPVTSSVDIWKREIRRPGFWRLAFDYLETLGPDTLSLMGYSFETTKRFLMENRPPWFRLIFTSSFKSAVRA